MHGSWQTHPNSINGGSKPFYRRIAILHESTFKLKVEVTLKNLLVRMVGPV